MAGNVAEFTDANFQGDVLSSDQPVLVDFWATWCQPCLMLTPTIEELANDFDGKVKIGKLNIDENRQAAMNYRVESIPTMIVFKNGEPVDRMLGAQPKARIAEMIQKHSA